MEITSANGLFSQSSDRKPGDDGRNAIETRSHSDSFHTETLPVTEDEYARYYAKQQRQREEKEREIRLAQKSEAAKKSLSSSAHRFYTPKHYVPPDVQLGSSTPMENWNDPGKCENGSLVNTACAKPDPRVPVIISHTKNESPAGEPKPISQSNVLNDKPLLPSRSSSRRREENIPKKPENDGAVGVEGGGHLTRPQLSISPNRQPLVAGHPSNGSSVGQPKYAVPYTANTRIVRPTIVAPRGHSHTRSPSTGRLENTAQNQERKAVGLADGPEGIYCGELGRPRLPNNPKCEDVPVKGSTLTHKNGAVTAGAVAMPKEESVNGAKRPMERQSSSALAKRRVSITDVELDDPRPPVTRTRNKIITRSAALDLDSEPQNSIESIAQDEFSGNLESEDMTNDVNENMSSIEPSHMNDPCEPRRLSETGSQKYDTATDPLNNIQHPEVPIAERILAPAIQNDNLLSIRNLGPEQRVTDSTTGDTNLAHVQSISTIDLRIEGEFSIPENGKLFTGRETAADFEYVEEKHTHGDYSHKITYAECPEDRATYLKTEPNPAEKHAEDARRNKLEDIVDSCKSRTIALQRNTGLVSDAALIDTGNVGAEKITCNLEKGVDGRVRGRPSSSELGSSISELENAACDTYFEENTDAAQGKALQKTVPIPDNVLVDACAVELGSESVAPDDGQCVGHIHKKGNLHQSVRAAIETIDCQYADEGDEQKRIAIPAKGTTNHENEEKSIDPHPGELNGTVGTSCVAECISLTEESKSNPEFILPIPYSYGLRKQTESETRSQICTSAPNNCQPASEPESEGITVQDENLVESRKSDREDGTACSENCKLPEGAIIDTTTSGISCANEQPITTLDDAREESITDVLTLTDACKEGEIPEKEEFPELTPERENVTYTGLEGPRPADLNEVATSHFKLVTTDADTNKGILNMTQREMFHEEMTERTEANVTYDGERMGRVGGTAQQISTQVGSVAHTGGRNGIEADCTNANTSDAPERIKHINTTVDTNQLYGPENSLNLAASTELCRSDTGEGITNEEDMKDAQEPKIRDPSHNDHNIVERETPGGDATLPAINVPDAPISLPELKTKDASPTSPPTLTMSEHDETSQSNYVKEIIPSAHKEFTWRRDPSIPATDLQRRGIGEEAHARGFGPSPLFGQSVYHQDNRGDYGSLAQLQNGTSGSVARGANAEYEGAERAFKEEQRKENERKAKEEARARARKISEICDLLESGKLTDVVDKYEKLLPEFVESGSIPLNLIERSLENLSERVVLQYFGKFYGVHELRELFMEAIAARAEKVLSNELFAKLELEEVKEILSMETLCAHEITVLRAVTSWLKHGWNSRKYYMKDVMSLVRFGSMSMFDVHLDPCFSEPKQPKELQLESLVERILTDEGRPRWNSLDTMPLSLDEHDSPVHCSQSPGGSFILEFYVDRPAKFAGFFLYNTSPNPSPKDSSGILKIDWRLRRGENYVIGPLNNIECVTDNCVRPAIADGNSSVMLEPGKIYVLCASFSAPVKCFDCPPKQVALSDERYALPDVKFNVNQACYYESSSNYKYKDVTPFSKLFFLSCVFSSMEPGGRTTTRF